jgi:hypothetical protein
MGFSRDAKDEAAALRALRPCCARTFVALLAMEGRALRARGAKSQYVVSVTYAAAARAILAAARRAGLVAHLLPPGAKRTVSESRAAAPPAPRKNADRSRLRIAVGPLAPGQRPPVALARRCCRRAVVRAAFLTRGSVSDPQRGYHVEIVCRRREDARFVQRAAASLGIHLGLTWRRKRPLLYAKDVQTVTSLLVHAGATHAALALQTQRVVRETKNAIRRTVNGETANAVRAAAAAARQRAAARRVLALGSGARLTLALREAAALRLAHPSRTLAELAALARPPVSKAAMAGRMRLLEKLAKR